MDGRPTWTDCDEAGDYVVPNVLSPRDLVCRPDKHGRNCTTHTITVMLVIFQKIFRGFRTFYTMFYITSNKINCFIDLCYEYF